MKRNTLGSKLFFCFFVAGIVCFILKSEGQTSNPADGHSESCGVEAYSSITEIVFTEDNLETEEYEREADLSLQYSMTDYTRSETYARIQIETKFSHGSGPVSSSLTIQGGHQWMRGEMEAMVASLSANYKLSRHRQVRSSQDYTYRKQGVLFRCPEPLRPSPIPLISNMDSGFAPDNFAAGYWPVMGNVNSVLPGFIEEWSENGFFYKWYWRKTAAVASGEVYDRRTLYVWKLHDSRDVLLAENENVAFLVNVANIHGLQTLKLILESQ